MLISHEWGGFNRREEILEQAFLSAETSFGNYRWLTIAQDAQASLNLSPLHSPDIPWWHSAKSYLRGSSGSNFFNASVISLAVFQSEDFLLVSPRHLEILAMWVSRGMINFEGEILSQIPKSISLVRTIHLRNRFRRLHALPLSGDGKNCFSPFGLIFLP